METAYLDLLAHVLSKGETRGDRTGTGTLGVFAPALRCDLADGFPMLTTKKVHWKSVTGELLWFLRGETNIRSLLLDGVTIWSEWPHAAYLKAGQPEGPLTLRDFERRVREDEIFALQWADLGPVYGAMWRKWPNGHGGHIDQVAEVERMIRCDPNSRRILLTAWNPATVPQAALPPCHVMAQFRVSRGRLDCHLYQRSADLFLGVPFNSASYALLTHMLAEPAGLAAGELVITMGDAHIYLNHQDAVREQLSRRTEMRSAPRLRLREGVQSALDYRTGDATLEGYDPMGAIRAPVAV